MKGRATSGPAHPASRSSFVQSGSQRGSGACWLLLALPGTEQLSGE